MKNRYVLDSYAILCFLQDEPGADRVAELLKQAKEEIAKLFTTWVNLGEVYYRVWREYGQFEAKRVLDVLSTWPMEILIADSELTIMAASVKAQNKLAYADAFAIGAALLHRAKVVTGDPEMQVASKKMDFGLCWLR
jgi:PIN domain nuclease of toxin-antitoxin system